MNAAALERFIAAAGPEVRDFAVLTFVAEISEAEFRAATAALGQPEWLSPPAIDPSDVGVYHRPSEPGMKGYYTLPSPPSYDLQLSRPEDPMLRALFDQIEPAAPVNSRVDR